MIARTSAIAHDHLSTKSTVLALKMYQVEGTIWVLRHLLEGSCEIAVHMHTSVRYVARTSRLRL